jgi:signal transduction histidine kinase
MELLTRQPPWGQARSVAAIVGMVAIIGGVDALSGAHISLRPFYFIPIALAVAWLGWRAATATAVLSVAVWFVGDYYAGSTHVRGIAGAWNVLISLSTFLIMVWTLHLLISLHREMEQRIRERSGALQEALAVRERLRRELLEIGARERNSIGHELHDSLSQHLTGTALAAQVLAERLARRHEPAAEDARKIVQLVQEGITQTRLLARGLLLSAIEPTRLGPELHDLAASATSQGGATCRFHLDGQPHPPDAATAAQLFRIAQEAVRNALKHAEAAHIDITFAGDDRELRLEIVDDGNGLPPAEQRSSGMGLKIMAHRAAMVGGDLSLENRPEGGTRIRCRLPAPHSAG